MVVIKNKVGEVDNYVTQSVTKSTSGVLAPSIQADKKITIKLIPFMPFDYAQDERDHLFAVRPELVEGRNQRVHNKAPLNALTTAALVLPGLISPTAAHAAEGDEVDFQYSHYQEGSRDIGVRNFDINTGAVSILNQKNTNPIEVDSLHGHGNFNLTDRIKFSFNYLQDTWGGATPISTQPSILGGNENYTKFIDGKDIVAGASPRVSSTNGFGETLVDKNFNFYQLDGLTGELKKSNQLTHVMATASPETRKQGDFKFSYDWDEAAISIGGGISVEDDYESRFGNIGGRLDFNQKRTTLNLDLSYTNSNTNAVVDHDLSAYLNKDRYYYEHEVRLNVSPNNVPPAIITGKRQDWGTHLGITQALNKDALLGADFSYTRSTGYMANPYKLTTALFINPEDFQFSDTVNLNALAAFLERRPEVRNQWNVGGRYVQYIDPLDAAFHFDYRFSADDWGIKAHTFEADWVQPLGAGWTVTPRVRYYSQDAADFYTPYLVVQESVKTEIINVNGHQIPVTANKLPANFSSDQRLSGFGTLSGGVTVAKQFAKGLVLETGFEYYTHQGSLKIGGGGEAAFADFDYWVANAALKADLNALALNGGGGSHAGHYDHQHHDHGVHAPAGVMFDHMLPKAGDFMVGYRYMYSSQGGKMLNGTNAVTDQAIVSNGCLQANSAGCFLTSSKMAMHMHMLDLMYAPTDWLTLMLMPQFMDMNMSMRKLDGVGNINEGNLDMHVTHHTQNGHETGGIGDLGMYALFKLFDNGMHHLHITAGFTAPTGDVNIQLRRNHQIDGGFIHYGMQLGSGTWDFKPSLTYTGHLDDFSWGAQANGTIRMEDKNESGYRLGDIFQATAWGSYDINHWLTASVRGLYTVQGSIQGQFNGSDAQFSNADGTFSSILKFGPQDYPSNYGGRYWDIGFGLSATVPSGDLAGNRVSVEWLQPVEDDVNGFQLERDGMLSATWNVAF